MDKVTFGKRIREARLEKGLTQQALAERGNISAMYLGEIERGIKMPSINSLVKIIEALDVSADYILRDVLTSGKEFVRDEIAEKLQALTPHQRKTAVDILDAYIKNLE